MPRHSRVAITTLTAVLSGALKENRAVGQIAESLKVIRATAYRAREETAS